MLSCHFNKFVINFSITLPTNTSLVHISHHRTEHLIETFFSIVILNFPRDSRFLNPCIAARHCQTTPISLIKLFSFSNFDFSNVIPVNIYFSNACYYYTIEVSIEFATKCSSIKYTHSVVNNDTMRIYW